MNAITQERFRPLIEQRLVALDARLREATVLIGEPALVAGTSAVASVMSTATVSGADTVPGLHAEQMRLENALQRIDAGTYGRCIRCGYNLPVERLKREPDAVTCDPCKPRRRNPRKEFRV